MSEILNLRCLGIVLARARMTVRRKFIWEFLGLVISVALAGCGLYTPEKDPFTSDAPYEGSYKSSKQADYESAIISHVTCEIANALKQQEDLKLVPWLSRWGTAVTLSITVEDQSGLAPGISTIAPFQNVVFPFPTGGNVVSPQSFSVSVGGTASVNALRTETIQFTLKNDEAIRLKNCNASGVLIDGDLKIREFVFDKAVVAAAGNGAWNITRPPYNSWTEEITFVSAYGGSATPTWKLARLTANTSSNLLVAQRTNTNDLIITLGPLQSQSEASKNPPYSAFQLTASAMNQHNARVQANAIAVSVSGQSH
jgi:hypothetical protein